MKRIFFIASALSIMISQTGCFGGFELTKKVWEFNESTFENKFLKTLLFYVLNIVPVYGVAGFLDVVIFNLIEFWTGSNPVAMEEGQYEEQFTRLHGEDYKITATKNKMIFQKVINKGEFINMGEMVFSEEETSWSFVKEGISEEIISIDLKSNTVAFNTLQGNESLDISNVECIALKTNNNRSSFALN